MHITGIGDNVVDRYLTLGQMFPGGNALNVAVLARRAGIQTAYIGAVGDDAAGALVRRALRDERVDISRLRVVPGLNAYADVVLDRGNRQFVGSAAGVSMFDPDEADLDFLSRSDIVHSSIYSGLNAWIQRTRGDLPFSFDFSDRSDTETVSSLAPGLVLATFSGSHFPAPAVEDLLRWTVGLGARYALATRGAEGAMLWANGRCWTCSAQPTAVLDTLGAGDAFIAGFLVATLRGAAPSEALVSGAAGAATACTHYGAFGRGEAVDDHHDVALSVATE